MVCLVKLCLKPLAGLLLHALHVHLPLGFFSPLVQQPAISRIVHNGLLHHRLELQARSVLCGQGDSILRKKNTNTAVQMLSNQPVSARHC
jgi:hypothetical protein